MNGEAYDWRPYARALADSLARDGIDARIADAIARVPRHLFVPEALRDHAYEDCALPIGCDQTISQPFIVAFMTQLLEVAENHRVLDVGTGSGYQAAVLCELGVEVFSLEILPELSRHAADVLRAAGYQSVHLGVGDAADGWPAHAPYRGIVAAAAARELPPALGAQLEVGGRIAIPLTEADEAQWIWKGERQADGSVALSKTLAVRFVPMTGRVRRD